MKLIRTFHPIGQGAFYTERHNVNGEEFNIVYDCGSLSLNGPNLDRKIKSTFPKNCKIDILFISHFHADHINGIEFLKKHCKIKTVVLPLLDNDAKTLSIVSNYLNDSELNSQIINNPNEYFGNETTVISISETNTEEGNDGINLEAPIDISTLKKAGIVFNGKAFVSGLSNHEWYFIPFNYRHIDRKIKFIDALSALNLTLTDINTLEKMQLNKVKIRKAYDTVDGDLNQNSMLLFSGNDKDEMIYTFQSPQNFYFHPRFHSHFQSSCIYFGDLDLKQTGIITDINRKLGGLLLYVGTIQVPHHGSIHNFNNSILSQMKCNSTISAVFSFGTTNAYGHPSDRVIGDLVSHTLIPYFVTEDQQSILIQFRRKLI